ncbi:MAG: hypothetical protein ABL984_17610 [Pyrinomonadaceae bacterium]
MRLIIFLTLIAHAAINLNAQIKPTTAADYNGTVQYAVSETNAAFPFVFTVVTETYDRGKLVSTETDINERQAEGIDRETKTLLRGGKTLRSFSIMVGYGNNTYCSTDGRSWKGPQEFVCPGPDGSDEFRIYGPRKPESVEYSVIEKSLEGNPVKVYRKYAIFAATEPNGKESFEEEIATIDSRGFFISVVDTEGTLDPKAITLIRKQTWDFETKFKPVVAPK